MLGLDVLGYHIGFMKVGTENFGAKHFDKDGDASDPYEYIFNKNFSNAVNGGALNDYYSSANEDIRIPWAEGFPYSRVAYENNGLGEVKINASTDTTK